MGVVESVEAGPFYQLNMGRLGEESRFERNWLTITPNQIRSRLPRNCRHLVIKAVRRNDTLDEIQRTHGRRISSNHYFVVLRYNNLYYIADAYSNPPKLLTSFNQYQNWCRYDELRIPKQGFVYDVRPESIDPNRTNPNDPIDGIDGADEL